MDARYEMPVGFRKIPRADERYVVAENGKVFNLKTKKPLKQQWDGYKLTTVIKDPNGRQFKFDASKVDDTENTTITKEWVFDVDKAKVASEFPNYAVSHYGAVYFINPKSSGPRVRMIKEHTRRGFPYVILRSENGKRKAVRSDLLTKKIWGDESSIT